MKILRGQNVVQPSSQTGIVDASVIVLSYNSQKTIRESLDSLAAQPLRFDFEVFVVDSSTDATATIVSQEYPWVRLVRLSRRALPGETRNVGIEHAKGKVIAFLASDCVADQIGSTTDGRARRRVSWQSVE